MKYTLQTPQKQTHTNRYQKRYRTTKTYITQTGGEPGNSIPIVNGTGVRLHAPEEMADTTHTAITLGLGQDSPNHSKSNSERNQSAPYIRIG